MLRHRPSPGSIGSNRFRAISSSTCCSRAARFTSASAVVRSISVSTLRPRSGPSRPRHELWRNAPAPRPDRPRRRAASPAGRQPQREHVDEPMGVRHIPVGLRSRRTAASIAAIRSMAAASASGRLRAPGGPARPRADAPPEHAQRITRHVAAQAWSSCSNDWRKPDRSPFAWRRNSSISGVSRSASSTAGSVPARYAPRRTMSTMSPCSDRMRRTRLTSRRLFLVSGRTPPAGTASAARRSPDSARPRRSCGPSRCARPGCRAPRRPPVRSGRRLPPAR